jgi:hypothetical protein
VEVMQFEPYAVCTPSSPLSAVCDRGVTAMDAEDGNLQVRYRAGSRAVPTVGRKHVSPFCCYPNPSVCRATLARPEIF